jgi:uncharacterized repeat protein (TIGR04052 family)
MTDLRFFVHDLELIAPDGQARPTEFVPDATWQIEQVALIDLEDGRGGCRNGSPEMNAVLRARPSGQEFSGIRFTIGVPAGLNHADPLLAAAPLSFTEMHWHWASGYKFLRTGVETDTDGFFLHLGSNRCEGTIGDIRGCTGSNRPEVVLAAFEPGRDRIIVDIGVLVAGVDFQDGEISRCMSGPANAECVDPFARLGLDAHSGEIAGASAVFSAGRIE